MPNNVSLCAAGKLRRRAVLRAGLALASYNSLAAHAPPLAIAGDLLLAPAGGPFLAGQVPPPPAQNELITLPLGATFATPTA